MSSFYDNNRSIIKNNYPEIYAVLNDQSVNKEFYKLDKIELVETRDGTTSISIVLEGDSYRLNSKYHPIEEAKKWAEQYKIRNLDTVISMFGFGNGLFIREIIKRLKNDDTLLIYEPCKELFYFVLEHFDITDLLSSKKIHIFVHGINDDQFKKFLSHYVNWANLNSQIVCTHPQYEIAFKESYKVFNKMLLDNNNYIVVNQNTGAALSKLMTNNTLLNLQYLKSCNIVTDFIGKFLEDVPAIIVAAGPSLDKNVEQLREAKGKAAIFAVDTAVKYLLNHNIEPDFIVTLDPQKSLHHLSDARCNNIPIFTRIEARPENLEKNNKKIILYNIEGYCKRLLRFLNKDTGSLNSGGSVATGAFSICKAIGFKKIILIGLDLAYSGNSTHAGGITVDVAGAGRYQERVEDICGNLISTRYDWYVYLKWFEEAIELLPDSIVIDATEGGAKIKGTIIMTLAEAINRYCLEECHVEDIINELNPSVANDEFPVLKECINKDIEDLEDIRENAKRGVEICAKLINKYKKSIFETEASIQKNKDLSNINEYIERKDVYELIDWDISEDTFSYMSDLYIYSDNEKENKLFTYQKASGIYSAIIKASDRMTPMLMNLKDNLLN